MTITWDSVEMNKIIWQYWETRGLKPAFIDGLHEIARRNSGCTIVQVTPESLPKYLPDMPREVIKIREIAHKADIIRAMLVERYGGMWLDSDAIVIQELTALFDLLTEYEFVGFNDNGNLNETRPGVRVNCFLSRPGGKVISQWVMQQKEKLPRTKFGWQEIGTEILHPICVKERNVVKILPFDLICPIPWDKVSEFESQSPMVDRILDDCFMVMLSNYSLKERAPRLRKKTCGQIAREDHLLGAIMRTALRGSQIDEHARSASLTARMDASIQWIIDKLRVYARS